MTLTIAIVVITALLFFATFNNEKMMNDLILYPPYVLRKNQYYRLITSGLIHADISHLAFNMITLYFFGKSWEQVYVGYYGLPSYLFLVLYFGGMIVADIPSLIKHANNYNYRSLGASGAVS